MIPDPALSKESVGSETNSTLKTKNAKTEAPIAPSGRFPQRGKQGGGSKNENGAHACARVRAFL